MTPTTARVIYPGLPDPLTQGDLRQLFNPSFDERKWAPSVARTPASQVALLVHLKIFQTIGRFLSAADVPLAAVEYVACRMAVESEATLICPHRTHYRHRQAILRRLKVVAWGADARALAQDKLRALWSVSYGAKSIRTRSRYFSGCSSLMKLAALV